MAQPNGQGNTLQRATPLQLLQRASGLSVTGGIVALVVGSAAFVAGADWLVLLIVYFALATAVTRMGAERKHARAAGLIEKTGLRDGVQVAANGGAFAAAALAFAMTGSPAWMVFAAGALAASSADTWATELGLLSRSPARSVTSGIIVPPGTSGGVTLQGTIAGIAGALLVAALTAALEWNGMWGAIALGGIAGMLLDSVLGAKLQERRWCPACGKPTERLTHACGSATQFIGGIRGLRNDGVNFFATIAGGAVAVTAWWAVR